MTCPRGDTTTTSRVRDGLLNLEEFSCLAAAQVLATDCAPDFDEEHRHSALGYRSPATFAADWATAAAA